MSLSTLRMNFYRIASLIIDHGAESMRCLLDQFIQKKYRSSFRDYVSNHQHEIYHHFNNGICCLCSKNQRRPYQTVISAWQMEKLFDKNSQKLSKHKYSSKCDYCCSAVKSTLLLQDIDITLLRFFLVTYFEEEFWQSCFTSGIVFHDFLNTHKHDIFHLLQLNTPCCICIATPGYTTMVLNEKDRLNKTQWETMFHTSEFPCIQHRNYCPNGYTLNPCSVSATIGIRHSDLDGRARMIILSKFCTMMRHIDGLVNARNTSYAHAIKGELSNEEFRQLWDEIENSIVYISNITSTVDSRKLCILELREKSLEESMCLELQCFILKHIHGDEQVLQACGKIQDTFEMVKEVIAQKLQQINLQITAFTSSISDVVRNELSVQLNEYSDTTRNIIDNTRKEIEFHDKDETYVQTSAVADATKLLESNNLLILFGRTGSGKTSTALEVASVFHANGYIIMKLEQDLAKDFKTYFLSTNKQLIIFEDLFGKADVRYNEDIHSNLLDVLKPHVLNGISKFIITVRSYKSEIDDEIASYHQLLSEGGVVNLNGSSSLSDLEKNNIIKMHAKYCGREISFNEIHNIVTTDPYLGFPEVCHLFCSEEKLFAMGHVFFTSPTEKFQNEINSLKRYGNTDIDSALKYCVLVCLMMDFACKDSFGKNIRRVAHKSNDPSNNFKNISSSVIEYLYQSLYQKAIMITVDEIQEMCKKLTNTYIKQDLNSNVYIFQHQTVFEAVLSSYWHLKTMADVIKYFKIDILAEHVRPFDSIVKGNKKYLFVPKSKCTDLAQKLFETFLANYNEIFKCYSLIKQSEFILNLFNLKLDEWYTKEENILKCDWIIITEFIRPFNYKKENTIICANANDKYLTQRLLNELDNRACDVNRYIERYGGDKFVNYFNEKLAEWFQSEETVLHCDWKVIDNFIRPTKSKMISGQIGTFTNDVWLIQRLINRLAEPISHKVTDSRTYEVKDYIERSECETFVKYFNEKLAEWFQSEETVLNCDWKVIYYFIRPTTFKMKTGQIGTVTNDDWLIQRLINRLAESISHKVTDGRTYEVKDYIEMSGCETFVKYFNVKLAEWFQSEETVLNCDWKVIYYFIRPTTFKMKTGQIGTVTNDDWLIQRLINRLAEPISRKVTDGRTHEVKKYIERSDCETFVKYFNEKLAEWFQSEETVLHCDWKVIYYFIRPTTFKMKTGQIGTVTNDDWLIQRLINRLAESISHKVTDGRTYEVKDYIEMSGCETFVKYFNVKLAEWFQSEETVLNCDWKVIYYFIRPTTFKMKTGQIGTVTNDDWLIQRLINRLAEPISRKVTDGRTHEVKKYIERSDCETFVKYFNEKLAEWFQSEETVLHCDWKVIYYFIRPTTFKLKTGQIGTFTNDVWLIQRLINRLTEPLHEITDEGIYEIKNYIERSECETFVKYFNVKLAEWFQSEETVLNCDWKVIYYFIRPTTFKMKTGQIGTVTNDDWLIQRLINRLAESISHKVTDGRTYEVKDYIERSECETFVKYFNEKLAEWFQSEETVLNCDWKVIYYFIRPTTFKMKTGQIGTVTNDDWLIQRLINRLAESISHKVTDGRTYEVKDYIEMSGCETFVKYFNVKLAEWFQSEETVLNCDWKVIYYFIRPTTFKMKTGQIGTVTNDDWLIQRLINRLAEPISRKVTDGRTHEVKKYIERSDCETFVKYFNEKLAEWFQSEETVLHCDWKVIYYFIRPTTFKMKTGQIGTVTNDDWLIQRLINRLAESISHKVTDGRTYEVKDYIEMSGCETFVKYFNVKLAEWFQSEETVLNCDWKVIYYFIRPTTFKMKTGQIGTVTNDDWLIQRLINRLAEPISRKVTDGRTHEVKKYIERSDCETFVKYFNEKLAEWFQSEETVLHCDWKVIYYFIRPTTFKLKTGQIGTFTNDVWLIQRLINRLTEPLHEITDEGIYEIKNYIERSECETFVNYFNEKLAEWFQSEETVLNCDWEVIHYFIRPATFKIKTGQIGTVTNDGWLIQRLINRLAEPISHKVTDRRTHEVKKYIEKSGCETFVKYFNEKLAEWFQSEETVLNCDWKVIYYFIRPTTCKIKSGQIGTVTNDGWLIQRLINRLEEPLHKLTVERIYEVKQYIDRSGCANFVKYFNKKLAERFQSEETVLHCDWKVIYNFIRPTTVIMKTSQIGTFTNDDWLIQRLINRLAEPISHKVTDGRTHEVRKYIKMYGCETFVKYFNDKLAEWFQSEETVLNCDWKVIYYFIRPTTCKIKSGQIGTFTNDGWLIQRLINRLAEPISHILTDERIHEVKKYIERSECETFVKYFNEKLAEWFQSEETVLHCDLEVIHYFIRPTTLIMKTGQIGTFTNDGWLIQRLINKLAEPISRKVTDERTYEIRKYIKMFGCETFVNYFNEKLAEWFQSEETVLNCDWKVIHFFIRPTTFKIKTGQIGTVTNDGWLIQRLINRLAEPISHKVTDGRTYEVRKYIKMFGCKTFVKYFNEKLAEWFQSEETVLNCDWKVIYYFIRPTTFKIKIGRIGTVTNDGWLIQRLINRLAEPISRKVTDGRTHEVKKYIERSDCETFVKYFNEKLAEWFQSEETVSNCDWKVIYYFIRPTTFKIKTCQIGTVTNDGWLIQRLINRLAEPISHKVTDGRTHEVKKYMERSDCETFVNYFNEKLAEWFQSEETVLNCDWKVIYYFIRPTTFKIKTGQIGTFTNDGWLIQRLINRLAEPLSYKLTVEVKQYIERYECEMFVNKFNERLQKWFQYKENVVKCRLHLFTTFVRPRSWLRFEKNIISIHDEHVISYLFSKLEQQTNVNTVKSYIRNYGSCEFITNFNERLKEKVERHYVLDQNCKWESLELFFDNVANSDASDIDNCFEDSDIDIVDESDLDSSISIDTHSSESDSNIDVDSSNHSEGSDNETNHNLSSNNNDNNGVLVMME